MRTLREYIRKREERGPAFRALREAGQPRQNVRLALIQARTAAGLTQEELARRLGTTQSAIARLERGTATPRVDTLQQLARVLGIRIEITPDMGLIIHQPQEQREVVTAGEASAPSSV